MIVRTFTSRLDLTLLLVDAGLLGFGPASPEAAGSRRGCGRGRARSKGSRRRAARGELRSGEGTAGGEGGRMEHILACSASASSRAACFRASASSLRRATRASTLPWKAMAKGIEMRPQPKPMAAEKPAAIPGSTFPGSLPSELGPWQRKPFSSSGVDFLQICLEMPLASRKKTLSQMVNLTRVKPYVRVPAVLSKSARRRRCA